MNSSSGLPTLVESKTISFSDQSKEIQIQDMHYMLLNIAIGLVHIILTILEIDFFNGLLLLLLQSLLDSYRDGIFLCSCLMSLSTSRHGNLHAWCSCFPDLVDLLFYSFDRSMMLGRSFASPLLPNDYAIRFCFTTVSSISREHCQSQYVTTSTAFYNRCFTLVATLFYCFRHWIYDPILSVINPM